MIDKSWSYAAGKRVPRYYCDECGMEKPLFYYGSRQLCADCLRQGATEKTLIWFQQVQEDDDSV